MKSVIVLENGKNVFPEELEEHLAERPDVIGEAVVIGRPNESGEVAITAVVYPNQEFAEGKTPDEIRRVTRELMAAFPQGGLVASPTHSVPGDVPPENLLAMLDVLEHQ